MSDYNVENKQTILNIIKRIANAENKDGFEIVGLFGSFAKGTATEFIAYKINHKESHSRF